MSPQLASKASKVSWDEVEHFDQTASDHEIRHVAVMGAGLVGSLTASMLAQRGLQVDLYEYRSDIRAQDAVQGRSINMTIAKRGLDTLQRIGMKETVLKDSVPLYGRMIHNIDGSTFELPYGEKDDVIWSISRTEINKLLITKAESHKNVTLHFNHKLTEVELNNTQGTFQKEDKSSLTSQFDAIFSADGSFSKTRQHFMRDTSFNFSQEYIDALYIELSILPDENGGTRMPLNYLHIWPRGHFMLIGLPNTDNSWTMTMFGPKKIYGEFQSEGGVMAVFNEYFPDVIPLMGRDRILADCIGTKGYPMVSVKCSPHVINNTVLVGDAAHAMVPFYGEGMNCGFEDILVLDELIESFAGKLAPALNRYSEARVSDTHAMCDLAMYNYIEMRDLVRSPFFKIRKLIDNNLHKLASDYWVPLYTSIRFQRKMGYKKCWENKQWQDQVISRTIMLGGVLLAGIILLILTGSQLATAICTR